MKNNNQAISGISLFKEIGTNEPEKVRFMVHSKENRWEKITWREFLEKAEAVALSLSQKGVGPGSKVAVYAKTRVEWAYFGLAIQACRAVFVPVFHFNTPDQVKYVIDHSDAEIVITEAELLPVILYLAKDLEKVKNIVVLDHYDINAFYSQSGISESLITSVLKRKEIIAFNDLCITGSELKDKSPSAFEELYQEASENDLSAILYTSGTTGNPKGVALTNYNLMTNAEDWINVLGPLIPEKRVDLLWLPLSHIFGWGELGLGNTLGFQTYFTNPVEVLKLMPEVKPTVFMSVPAYWEKLHLMATSLSDKKDEQIGKLHEITGGELQFCLSGGAGLKREVKEFFLKAGLLIIEGYGLTECSPTLTMNRKDDFDFNSVGKPFPRVELKLASDGEVLAKGPNVFTGYYKDEKSTKETFDEEGWLKTGDLGEFTDKGFLKIKGRKKEIIVTSGGKNISPQMIESKFKDDPYIENIVLYGNERKYLVALVTLREASICEYAGEKGVTWESYLELTTKPEIKALISERVESVNSELAKFETIKDFHIHDKSLTVAEGFLTSSLKLKRSIVYEKFGDKLDKLYV